MNFPLKFTRSYFIITILLFVIEILIALFIDDGIIRPYIGDLLVVILIYCFVKSFFNTPVFPTAIAALIFSYIIEILQYFNIINLLGLQNSKTAATIMGNSFAWFDLIAYTLGITLVLFIERLLPHKNPAQTKSKSTL